MQHAQVPAPSRRRARQAVKRSRTIRFDLTEAEFGEIRAAAEQAGLAKGAFAARAALAVARGGGLPADSPHRQALGEFIRAAGLVRRIGVNLNQAVAKLNATGQRSGDLLPYAAESVRRAQLLDQAAEELRRQTPAMIGKISARGARVAGLIYYLYGPGRNEEHTDPHLVAGWRAPGRAGTTAPRRRPPRLPPPEPGCSSSRTRRSGPRGFERPVWHCSVRAAPRDRMLSDDEWAQVARDIMHRTGLAPHGQDDDAVRWVAVRHAPDHIHIVAMLARQDGTRPRFWNDYYRVGEACRAAEERFGLRRTAPRDRTARAAPDPRGVGEGPPPRPFRAAPDHTPAGGQHRGRRGGQRAGVLRPAGRRPACWSASGSAPATLARSPATPSRCPATRAESGGPVWFGGGKLAADLTLPKLRHRWDGQAAGPARGQPHHDRRTERDLGARRPDRQPLRRPQIRQLAGHRPGAAADAAWAAADTLHAAASALGSRVLRQAADSYARAARLPYGRRAAPDSGGGSACAGPPGCCPLAAPARTIPCCAQIALISG